MKKLMSSILVVFSLFWLVGCTAENKEQSNDELKIITTFFPVYDFTRNVVGSEQDIEMLINSAVEPHDYEPSAKDIAKIQDADVFIYNSLEMETWVAAVLKAIDTDKVTVIEASQGITLLQGDEEHGHHHDSHEEHEETSETHKEEKEHDHSGLHFHGVADHYHTGDQVVIEAQGLEAYQFETIQWLVKIGKEDFKPLADQKTDTLRWKISEDSQLQLRLLDDKATVVAETSVIDLSIDNHDQEHDHSDHYHEFDPHVWLDPTLVQKQVATIESALSKLNPSRKNEYQKNSQAYQAKLTKLDQDFKQAFEQAEKRTFVTQHTAFAYLAKRYNLEQVGISGISPDMEPTASQLAKIETFVKEQNVTVIFTEDTASPKIAKTIAEATGAELAVLSPLESLSEEAMQAGQDYLSVMEQNLAALKMVIN